MALTNDELIFLDNAIKKVLGNNNPSFEPVKSYIVTKVTEGTIVRKDLQFRMGSVIREAISKTLPIESGDAIGIKVIDGVTYEGDGAGRFVELSTSGGSGSTNGTGSVNSVNGKQGDVILGKLDFGLELLDRPDKVLSSLDIAKIYYDADTNIIKIQYLEVADIHYETFTYVNGDLATVKHYIDGILKGTSILNKNAEGELDSTQFIGA